MPNFTSDCSSGCSAKASRPMNRLMVKPMPQSTATPRNCVQLAPTGRSASLRRIITADRPKTPTTLPASRPSATPSVSGASRMSDDRLAKETPALAKPKTGTMMKATGLLSACSSRCSGDSPPLPSGVPGVRWMGMHSASSTPATVACTPERNTSTQSTSPSSR
jgi:hypothetical protein